jgi:hypothetical protein
MRQRIGLIKPVLIVNFALRKNGVMSSIGAAVVPLIRQKTVRGMKKKRMI